VKWILNVGKQKDLLLAYCISAPITSTISRQNF